MTKYHLVIDENITLEGFERLLSSLDWYYSRSEDFSKYERGRDHLNQAREFANKHDNPRYYIAYLKEHDKQYEQ